MFGTDTNGRGDGRVLRWLCPAVAVAALAAACTPSSSAEASPRAGRGTAIRMLTIRYTTHAGAQRSATVVLPAWYGPSRNPRVPLVISPHGRNGTGRENAGYWGNLPAVGGFAVVNPDGMGRRLPRNSFGYSGQVDDLARMPDLLTTALPWLRIDRERIYALGSSMGGQETLLLVARHPGLLAGAVAMDSVTDLSRRYGQMPETECDASCLRHYGRPYGQILQQKLAQEVGGGPSRNPRAYALRSPLLLAKRIADSHVPLSIWWSTVDRVVTDQAHQSGALYRALRLLDQCAPVSSYVGTWRHSHEMRAGQLLPLALVKLGLLTKASHRLPASVTYRGEPTCA
jgi:dipeptidyl aminopeptidase/acylaminoacyl peptidase